MPALRVFIGFDPNETVAMGVLAHSIWRHASVPVFIVPLNLKQLPLTRPRDPHQSTEFAFSRFLVPWLCDYKGVAAFMDCDMLCRADIAELFASVDPARAVSVVQHDYTPAAGPKFLDQPQTRYERKNWSSVMVFNNDRCRALSPEYVNAAPGLQLHQFRWLDDADIGRLEPEWNYLVGESGDAACEPKLVHYTRGGPWFAKFKYCPWAEEWFEEKRLMLAYNKFNEFSLPERTAEGVA